MENVTSLQLTAANFIFYQPPASLPGYINGTANNDNLEGDAGSNLIDGKAGADTMTGRTGDDNYIVDNIGDTVNELPGGGFDTVKAGVTFTLTAEVESLVMTGSNNLDGSGNQLANRITGNGGNNRLDGGTGVDTLLGGLGDDTYIVDNQADSIFENAAEGTDTVQSSVSYTLGNQIENMTLSGLNAINATGNSLSNILIGNAGDNTLDGAAGADVMRGGLGDDAYFVDNATDLVTENLNEGIDKVLSNLSYTLANNVENLTLIGVAAINGTGNTLDNILVGTSAANSLNGGLGNDILTGGNGIDHFLFTTALGASNVDTLTDFVSGTDKIDLSKAIFTAFSGVTVGGSLSNAEIGNHMLYNANTGALSYDADGSTGAGVAVQIALVGLSSHPATLQGIDFKIAA